MAQTPNSLLASYYALTAGWCGGYVDLRGKRKRRQQ